jgi:hypothetical protein
MNDPVPLIDSSEKMAVTICQLPRMVHYRLNHSEVRKAYQTSNMSYNSNLSPFGPIERIVGIVGRDGDLSDFMVIYNQHEVFVIKLLPWRYFGKCAGSLNLGFVDFVHIAGCVRDTPLYWNLYDP